MEKITKITAIAIDKYFEHLIKFGYKNYEEVHKILILTFLESMLSRDFYEFITEKDYNTIVSAVYCLARGTWLIDFPSYATYDTILRTHFAGISLRASESSILRICESNYIRVKV